VFDNQTVKKSTDMNVCPTKNTLNRYYTDKLSAQKLKKVYEIAPPRVRQYLEAEINHCLEKIKPDDLILELGCGYGRIFLTLSRKAKWVMGIDTSIESLLLAKEMSANISNCSFINMDAVQLGFSDRIFDVVLCIQNGISAFKVNQKELIRESIRVTKPGGNVLFSSYSEKFWKDRLEWFRLQSEAGLLGKIDYEKTKDGVIVCLDGFKATTVGKEQFLSLIKEFNVHSQIVEVDNSSLFCEMVLHKEEE
jgi:ubiquinone/menaquinone biosynthesis C-methylase UbiE